MFLEQRVGRVEDRLGELEARTSQPDQATQQKLAALEDSDLRLRAEAAALQQRLADVEKLALERRWAHIQKLLHELENRLANAESHDSRQLGLQKTIGDRLSQLEKTLESLSVEEVAERLQMLDRQAEDIYQRLEEWDRHGLAERTTRLEHLADAASAFKNESQQLFEILRNDLTAQADRDDQLFDLLNQLQSQVQGLDIQRLQERVNDAESALAGFRAVVKEVRQRFDQADQKHTSVVSRLDELETRFLQSDERLQGLAGIQEQFRVIEEQLLELDFAPFQQRLGVIEDSIARLDSEFGRRLDDFEGRLRDMDVPGLHERIRLVEATAGQLGQQFEALLPFAESATQRLDQSFSLHQETAEQIEDHEQRLSLCESQSKQVQKIAELEKALAEAKGMGALIRQLNEQMEALKADNRELKERLRSSQPSVAVVGSSADWFSRGVATLGLAAAVVLAWLMFRPQPVLTAQQFVLKGADGNVYADLAVRDGGGNFQLLDAAGKPMLVLNQSTSGPGIRLADPAGTDRAVFGFSNGAPGLVLIDASGTPRLELGASESGYFALRDTRGDRRALMTISPQGPQFALMHPTEQPYVLVGAGAMGDGLSIYDNQHRLRAGMGVTVDGAAVNLFDEQSNRRVVISANKAGPALAFLGNNDEHRTTIGMSANGESVLNLHDATGAQRIVLHVSESDAKVNVLDAEKNVVFATP